MGNGIFGQDAQKPVEATPIVKVVEGNIGEAIAADVVKASGADADKLKESKKAASKRLMDRKAKALNQLIDLAKRLGNDEEKAAATYLEPGRHIAGVPGAPKVKKDVFSALFPTVGTVVHEDEVFKREHLGRKEMGILIKANVGSKWVTFNPDSGNYTLVAIGSDIPEGWVGPLPKVPKAL